MASMNWQKTYNDKSLPVLVFSFPLCECSSSSTLQNAVLLCDMESLSESSKTCFKVHFFLTLPHIQKLRCPSRPELSCLPTPRTLPPTFLCCHAPEPCVTSSQNAQLTSENRTKK